MVVLTKKKNVSKSKSRNGSRTKFRSRSKTNAKNRSRTRKYMRGGSSFPKNLHIPQSDIKPPTMNEFEPGFIPHLEATTESSANIAPNPRLFNTTRRFFSKIGNTLGATKRKIMNRIRKTSNPQTPNLTVTQVPGFGVNSGIRRNSVINAPPNNFKTPIPPIPPIPLVIVRSDNFTTNAQQQEANKTNRNLLASLFTPKNTVDPYAEAAYNADLKSQRTGITDEEYENFLISPSPTTNA